MALTIVPMTPDMVSEVVKLHQEAFHGHLSTRIGTNYVRYLVSWFLENKNTVCLVAFDANRIVGYLLAAPAGSGKIIDRKLLWVAVRGILAHPSLLLSRQLRQSVTFRLRTLLGLAPPTPMVPELPQPTMSLVGIGVTTSAQGKKVGLGLMRAFEARTLELKMRSLQLYVYPDNTAARRLYERCGWQPVVAPLRRKQAMRYFRILTAPT